MIELKPTEVDDPQFVELASQVLNRLIRLHAPEEVYAIQIDHWFDHKWEQFSGTAVGVVGVWRSTLTVPPFNPGRVVSQSYFRAKDPSRGTYDAGVAKPLHLDQWSSRNLNRLIKQVSSSGLFLWYSGETTTMDRASLMAYSVQGEETIPWYASFVKKDGWKLNKVRGISRVEFDLMVA